MKPTEPIIINSIQSDSAPIPVPSFGHRRVVDMTDIVTKTAHSRMPSDKAKKGNRKTTKSPVHTSSVKQTESRQVALETLPNQPEPAVVQAESPYTNIQENTDALPSSFLVEPKESKASPQKTTKAVHTKKPASSSTRPSTNKKPEKTSKKARQFSLLPTQEQLQLNDYIINTLLLQSWLSHRWCSCITKMFPDTVSQFTKGISFVQARLVNDFCITPGGLEAIVVDQFTSIQIRQFDPNHWKKVIERLSDKAIFAAELLNGELSEDILNTFTEENLPLFPTHASEFDFTCDCGAEKMPCEHVCALLLAFSQTLKDSPFNILLLRGMSQDNLIAQLNEKRSTQNNLDKSKSSYNNELPVKDINFSTFYAPRGDFSEIEFHIFHENNTLIKRLGTPEAWSADHFVGCSVESCMNPILEAVSREAEALGHSDPWQLTLNAKEREELEQHRLNLELEQQRLANLHVQKQRQSMRMFATDANHYSVSASSEQGLKPYRKVAGKINHYQIRDTIHTHTRRKQVNFSTSEQNIPDAYDTTAFIESPQTNEVRHTLNSKKQVPKHPIPNMSFVASVIPSEINEFVNNPVEIAAKVYEWLTKCGQTDARTLARRTQSKIFIIQAFLDVLCDAGLVQKIELEDEKVKYDIV